MKKVIDTERVPIKLWLDDVDENTLYQARNLANLPFVFKHVCLMPDAHTGYGMPIGGVMATDGVIVPNAVGVDIGCGMLVAELGIEHIDPKKLDKVIREGYITKANELAISGHDIMAMGYSRNSIKEIKKSFLDTYKGFKLLRVK